MSDPTTTSQAVDHCGLILFVAGDAPRSRRARANLAAALDAAGRERQPREIDVLADPGAALRFGMFATPALVRPDPAGGAPAVLYGDLSDRARLERFLAE